MPWKSTLLLAAVAFLAPAWADEPKPVEPAVTPTTTLPGHRGYMRTGNDPEGLPTGLPGFSSPPVPIEGEKPGQAPKPKPE